MYPKCLYLVTNQGYIIIHVIASQTRPDDQSLTTAISGSSRFQENVKGFLEQAGAIEMSVQNPSAYGHFPAFTNPTPIHGHI